MVYSGFAISCKKTQKIVIPENKVISDNKTVSENKPVNQPTIKNNDTRKVPRYEIIKETNLLRSDKSTTYFILINRVDLSSDAFIGQIKNLIKQVVVDKKKKENVTIEIFDSQNALELAFKDKNSKEPLLKMHFIAKYIGDSNGEKYKNTLYIFPNGEKEKSKAGEYFDIIDFNPIDW